MCTKSGRMPLVSDQKVMIINYNIISPLLLLNYIPSLPSKGMNLDI